MRSDAAIQHAGADRFVGQAFMRGVLIDQHESAGVLHQNVELVQHPDDLELLRISSSC